MKLDFSAPFSRFFHLMGSNFALFLGLGVVGVVLPSLAINYGLFSQLGFTVGDWTTNMADLSPLTWGWLAGGGVLMFVLQLVNLSMVTEVAILRAVGKPIDIGAAFGRSLINLLPLIAISILVGLMVMGGFILLIVPGIIWALCACVAVPAYVGERGIGVFGAISRSFALTRGNRWTLFALFLVLILAAMMIGGVIGLGSAGAVLSQAASGELEAGMTASGVLPVLQAVNTVVEALMNVVSNVFVAAIYVSLRELPGKVTASQAAAVFE